MNLYNHLNKTEASLRYLEVRPVGHYLGKSFPTVTSELFAEEDPSRLFRNSTIVQSDDTTAAPGCIVDLSDEGAITRVIPSAVLLSTKYTAEERLTILRASRIDLLNACDPLVMRHISQPENAKTLTEAQYAELQGYMQALRDFPANVDLDNIVWPPKPAFIL